MNPFIYQPETEEPKMTVKPPPRVRSRGLSLLSANSAPAPSNSRPELNKLTSTKLVSGSNKNTRRMSMLLPPKPGNFLGRKANNNAATPVPEPFEANNTGLRSPGESRENVMGTRGPPISMLHKKETEDVDDANSEPTNWARKNSNDAGLRSPGESRGNVMGTRGPPPPSISVRRKKETEHFDDDKGANSERTNWARKNSNDAGLRSPGESRGNVMGLRGRPPPSISTLRKKDTEDFNEVKGANMEPTKSWSRKNSNPNLQFQSQQSATKANAVNSRMRALPPRLPPSKKSSQAKITNEDDVDKVKQNYKDEPAMSGDNNYDLEEDVLSAVVSILNVDLDNDMPSTASQMDLNEERQVERGNPLLSSNSLLAKDEYVYPSVTDDIGIAFADDEYIRPNDQRNNELVKDSGNFMELEEPESPRSPFRGLLAQTGIPNEPLLDLALEELLAGEFSGQSLSLPDSPVFLTDGSAPEMESAVSQNQPDNGQDLLPNLAFTSEENATLSEMNGWDDSQNEEEDEGEPNENLSSNNGWDSPDEDWSEGNDEGDNEGDMLPVTMDRPESNDKQGDELKVDVDNFMAFLASMATDLEVNQADLKSTGEALSDPMVLSTPSEGMPEVPAEETYIIMGEELVQSPSPQEQSPLQSPIILKSLGKSTRQETRPVASASLRSNAQKARQPSLKITTSSDAKPFVARTPKLSSPNPASKTHAKTSPAKSIQNIATRVVVSEQPTSESSTLILRSLPNSPSFSDQISKNLKSDAFDKNDLDTSPSEPKQLVLSSQSFLDKFNTLMVPDDSAVWKSPSPGVMDSDRDFEYMI